MEREFCFACTAPENREQARQEIAHALEKRLDLYTRERCPRLMALTDRINSVPKVSPEVSERRARRRTLFGGVDWVLGTVLLMAAWTDPAGMPVVLGAGIVGAATGIVLLWRRRRRLLAVLQIVVGLLLAVVMGTSGGELAGLAGMGIVYLVIGVAALIPGRRPRESTFEKQAAPLAERLEWAGGQQVRLIFSDTGMRLAVGEDISQEYPDDQLETAVETEHLLMLAVADQGVALQKKDLPGEDLPALRRELARMKYTHLMTEAG